MESKTYICEGCGLEISYRQKKTHERSIWHSRQKTIKAALDAHMSNTQIARLLDVSTAWVSIYLKKMRTNSFQGNLF